MLAICCDDQSVRTVVQTIVFVLEVCLGSKEMVVECDNLSLLDTFRERLPLSAPALALNLLHLRILVIAAL
jgi:hypothetical protein